MVRVLGLHLDFFASSLPLSIALKNLSHFWLAGGDVFLEDIIVDIFFLSSVTYTLDTQIFTKLEKQLCKLFLFDILIISYEKFLVLIYLCIVIMKP